MNISEAVAQRRSVKKVILRNSQNSPENTVLEFLFDKVVDLKACKFIKKGSITGVSLSIL